MTDVDSSEDRMLWFTVSVRSSAISSLYHHKNLEFLYIFLQLWWLSFTIYYEDVLPFFWRKSTEPDIQSYANIVQVPLVCHLGMGFNLHTFSDIVMLTIM